MRARPLTVVVAVSSIGLLGLTSACGAAKKADTVAHAAASAASAVQSGGAAPVGKLTGVKIRVANLFVKGGQPGPAMDFYDVQPSPYLKTKPTPIVANLAYGSFSDYVQPHSTTTVGQPTAELFAMPAGADPIANAQQSVLVGGVVDDGSQAQATVLLMGSSDTTTSTDPLGGLSDSLYVEKGDDGQGGRKGPLAPPADSGQSEFLVSAQPLDSMLAGSHGWYFFVDDSCNPPLNGDKDEPGIPYVFAVDGEAPVSSFAIFAAAPGSHHLTAVENHDSTGVTCATLTPKQGGTDVTTTAGQQNLAFIYGTSPADIHLAVAPIAP